MPDAFELGMIGFTFLVILSLLVGIAVMLQNTQPVRIGTGRRRTGQTGSSPAGPAHQGPFVAGRW